MKGHIQAPMETIFNAPVTVVKLIGRRLQISGARWNTASVNPMLSLRCTYLNGQLAS